MTIHFRVNCNGKYAGCLSKCLSGDSDHFDVERVGLLFELRGDVIESSGEWFNAPMGKRKRRLVVTIWLPNWLPNCGMGPGSVWPCAVSNARPEI
jgi:hypothetical protein